MTAEQVQTRPPAGKRQAHRDQKRPGRPGSPALPAGGPAGQQPGVPQGRADHQRAVPPHAGHDSPGDGQERTGARQRAGLQEETARVHGAARRHEGQVGQNGVRPAERGGSCGRGGEGETTGVIQLD